jgi:hypothetical protein
MRMNAATPAATSDAMVSLVVLFMPGRLAMAAEKVVRRG